MNKRQKKKLMNKVFNGQFLLFPPSIEKFWRTYSYVLKKPLYCHSLKIKNTITRKDYENNK